MKHHLQKIVVLAGSCFLLVGGCDRDQEVRSYQTPKETAGGDGEIAGLMKGADSEGGTAKPQAALDIQWTLPGGWKQVEVSGDAGAFFRPDARIQVDPKQPELLLSVSHLGDSAGARSLQQNINRWEGQEGLPASPEAHIPKLVTTIQAGDVTINEVDLNGSGKRLLGAIIPHADRTWFLKLAGPAEAVGAHKAEFDQFVRSVRFDANANAPAPANPAPAPQATSAAPGVKWQVPEGWTAQPATAMLVGKFQAGAATVKISSFAFNNFGNLELNLNRWRGEVGVGPVPPQTQDVPDVQIGGRAWKEYDFTGSGVNGAGHSRVIVAQTREGNDVYFFKISGPADAVAQQKPAFDQFVASVRFGS